MPTPLNSPCVVLLNSSRSLGQIMLVNGSSSANAPSANSLTSTSSGSSTVSRLAAAELGERAAEHDLLGSSAAAFVGGRCARRSSARNSSRLRVVGQLREGLFQALGGGDGLEPVKPADGEVACS